MALPRLLRVLLVLGRISNLPTVWSNCLAAWLLNGGESWSNLFLLCTGATFLYTGGMFLNDAFDADFDRQHRAERPIPTGEIGARAVWQLGFAWLAVGWLALLPLGMLVAMLSSVLVACILAYDKLHKRTPLAPLLMAACRFLLYVLAGAATQKSMATTTLWHGLALAAYVAGLSYLARGESKPDCAIHWPLVLLAAPAIANATLHPGTFAEEWIGTVMLTAWIAWCICGGLRAAAGSPSRTVAGLLAGIVLVDWSAVAPPLDGASMTFLGLFLLALTLQRTVPAT